MDKELCVCWPRFQEVSAMEELRQAVRDEAEILRTLWNTSRDMQTGLLKDHSFGQGWKGNRLRLMIFLFTKASCS